MKFHKVLILDFGSQFTQLIARRIRELGVYSEICGPDMTAVDFAAFKADALILSGGPNSVFEERAPTLASYVESAIKEGLPTLAICYGQQLIAQVFGGTVSPGTQREYGKATLELDSSKTDACLKGLSNQSTIWMSHGDKITTLPASFEVLGKTKSTEYAIIKSKDLPIYGLQFHPEVTHSEEGKEMLANFLFEVAKISADWKISNIADSKIAEIKEQTAGRGKVLLGLSGGVDSSVVAALLSKAIGRRCVCVFVDNGLLRKGEREKVESVFNASFDLELITVDASEKFLTALAGVSEPEQKRKIIGRVFVEVFEEAAKSIEGIEFLAQGTLYPDVIESTSHKGPSATIKSHHNVGGLPDSLSFELVEPLRELFKDEVRYLGEQLGLPAHICWRQPFPGPGLGIRIPGEITKERCDLLREADAIVVSGLEDSGCVESHKLWQYFCVLLPVKSVGVMGDFRTYEDTLVIRAVNSVDGMTADWARVPYDILDEISRKVVNEVKGINRVLYDITSKPPGTIEWE